MSCGDCLLLPVTLWLRRELPPLPRPFRPFRQFPRQLFPQLGVQVFPATLLHFFWQLLRHFLKQRLRPLDLRPFEVPRLPGVRGLPGVVRPPEPRLVEPRPLGSGPLGPGLLELGRTRWGGSWLSAVPSRLLVIRLGSEQLRPFRNIFMAWRKGLDFLRGRTKVGM